MNTEHEYECKAWVNGKLVDVVAVYETEYPKALVYGIFAGQTDVTKLIHPDEFDRIYREISTKVVEDMTDAAEMAVDMER